VDGRLTVPAATAGEGGPGITIRRMIPADASAVRGLLAESPEAAQWTTESIAELAQSGTGWIAVSNNSVTGFLIGRLAADEFEILNMAVARAYRGQGLGARLISEALAWAIESGAGHAHLEVRASNQAARRLYERAGFRQTGYRDNYYSGPVESALILSLKLSEKSS
jgi:ribosomal-protein-alanine N-acetyltransferase